MKKIKKLFKKNYKKNMEKHELIKATFLELYGHVFELLKNEKKLKDDIAREFLIAFKILLDYDIIVVPEKMRKKILKDYTDYKNS